MKQNFPSAKVATRLLFLLVTGVSLLFCGCVTYSRQTVPDSGNTSHAILNANLIDINTATADELERLPGIGETIADRIVEHRKQYGPFRRVEHLMMVRGISEQKFQKLTPLITASGN